MEGLLRAPWTLRAYAGLVVCTGVAVAALSGDESSWVRALWAVVFGLLVCSGSRFIWWLVVAVNAVVLVAAPFLFERSWAAVALSALALACLLARPSRDYVFRGDDGAAAPKT